MVGDRLDTDVLFGKNGGLTTMLVLSGALELPRRAARRADGGQPQRRGLRCRMSCAHLRPPSRSSCSFPTCIPIISHAGAGVTTEEQLLSPENSIHPDAYMDSLAALLEVKQPVAA